MGQSSSKKEQKAQTGISNEEDTTKSSSSNNNDSTNTMNDNDNSSSSSSSSSSNNENNENNENNDNNDNNNNNNNYYNSDSFRTNPSIQTVDLESFPFPSSKRGNLTATVSFEERGKNPTPGESNYTMGDTGMPVVSNQTMNNNDRGNRPRPGCRNSILRNPTNLSRRGSLLSNVSFDEGVEEHGNHNTVKIGTSSSADTESVKSDANSPIVQFKRRASLSASLRASIKSQTSSTGVITKKKREMKKSQLFRLVTIVLPCLVSLWYSAAILFPPGAREKYSFFLWDDGQLMINDETGQPSICPRPSICSEGITEIILIGISRLSAFATYAVMGMTFFSKMHYLIRFLSSSYIRTFIPFESLHHVHTRTGTCYAVLAFIHAICHYIRYIIRQDISQLGTQVHISGLCGILSMMIIIFSMSSYAKRFKDTIGKFEKRLNSHWMFVVLTIAMCFHHGRTRFITLTFFGLWSLDYIYGLIFGTFNLEVVELMSLPDDSGVQMLWRNPPGFSAKSGEYVKIQLPWLTNGGKEWHPFSIYLRESTERGVKSMHNLRYSNRTLGMLDDFPDVEGGDTPLSLAEYIKITLMSEFEIEPIDAPTSFMKAEAREQLNGRFETTQVFICPVGDWSKGLIEDLKHQKQLRACWVRGPYTSPYFVAQDFSHLILTASGIGITPALGVMGQYPGFSRTKILIWSTRDANMLKFFAPLIKDAHLAVVFYTGKNKLSSDEVDNICSYGNIFIQQSRPASLPGTIESIILEFENHIYSSSAKSMSEIERIKRAAWCVLYCGGSTMIRDDLHNFAKENKVGFNSELFDW